MRNVYDLNTELRKNLVAEVQDSLEKKQARKPRQNREERGKVIKCFHKCKNVLTSVSFWVGLTLGFPLEHLLWEKVWPFHLITKLMGL